MGAVPYESASSMFSNKPNVTAGNKLKRSSMRTPCKGLRSHVFGRNILRKMGCMNEMIERGTSNVCPTRRRSSRLSISRSMPYESAMEIFCLDLPLRRGILSWG